MKRKKHLQSGFTLIELLVVVAVIGIIASVGVVSYSGYVTSTKMKTAENFMSQLMFAQTEYHSDKGGYYTQANAKCTPDADTTKLVTEKLGVPVPDNVPFNFCVNVHDTTNYEIQSLWIEAEGGKKYKDCAISINNVASKNVRTSECE